MIWWTFLENLSNTLEVYRVQTNWQPNKYELIFIYIFILQRKKYFRIYFCLLLEILQKSVVKINSEITNNLQMYIISVNFSKLFTFRIIIIKISSTKMRLINTIKYY